MSRVDKPALLRRMFDLACDYSGQILSYQKMLGQLVDAGNTVILAHYLELLGGAGMVTGLQKFSQGKGRSGLSWWVVSLLLGPVATFLIVALDPVMLKSTPPAPNTTKGD
jgi:hypothetical protein